MSKCQVPDCGREFKNNAGLASHMAMEHKLRLDGTPFPPGAKGTIEYRRKRISEGLKERAAKGQAPPSETPNWHTPEARAKAAATKAANFEAKNGKPSGRPKVADLPNLGSNPKRDAHYAKLAAKGIHRCQECSLINHKIVDFGRAVDLGKHRRFAHGVLGKHAHKRNEDEIEPPSTVEASVEAKCPHCERVFKNKNGLAIHMGTAHPDQSDTSTSLSLVPTKELTNGNGSTQRTTRNGAAHEAGRGYSDDASYVTALAVSNCVGKLESILLATAHEHDIPPRQFARRCILALSGHYST